VLRELPEGWEWKRLEEAAEINMGQSPSGSSYNENGEGTPFLQGNAEFGDTFPKHKKFTTEPSKIASKGSVLISVRAPVGDTNIANLNYCIGRGLASLSLKNGDNKYLLYLLRSMKPLIEAKGTGSTFKAISKSIINEIEIPIPPLSVQRQIVTVLEQTESVKRQRQEADALTAALLQNLFSDMFGDLDKSNREWQLVNMEDFVFFQEGPGIRKWQFKTSGIKLLNVANLVNGVLNLDKTDRHVDPDEVAQKYQHFLLDPEDIVMASSGVTWGKTAIISCDHLPLMLNTSTIRFRPIDENRLDKKYLRVFLDSRSFKNQIDKLVTGSAQPNFGSSHLKQVRLILPPFDLQQQFSRIVQEVERIREQQMASGKEIDILFNGLMEKAFCGELVA
jgi:type I restriction enzyme S subunit